MRWPRCGPPAPSGSASIPTTCPMGMRGRRSRGRAARRACPRPIRCAPNRPLSSRRSSPPWPNVPTPLLQLATALAGRYTIERQLGQGGMAAVYLATDRKHDRKVALKVLSPELAASLGAERFLREIHIAARLTHPHILPLIDSGDADGTLYYV